MSLDPLRLLPAAAGLVGRVPEPVVDRVVGAVGTVVGSLPSERTRRIAAHTARLRPDLTESQLRRAVRANMRGYLRYFAEALTLGRLTEQQIIARFRAVHREHVQPTFDAGRPVVAALLHAGNWDLAGAWSCLAMAPVLTVAERLRPDALHEQFVRLRTDLGMTILVDDGSAVLPRLMDEAPRRPHLVPLLADRDLGRTGVEVTVADRPMLVAAGPAALALALDVPLVVITIRHERLTGERARRAGSRWGIVTEFSEPVTAGDLAPGLDAAAPGTDGSAGAGGPVHDGDGAAGAPGGAAAHAAGHAAAPRRPRPVDRTDVVALTRAWVDVAEPFLRRHPEQWHMLQRVFLEDLDAARLAAGRAREAEGSGVAGSGTG
ncbi:phosphatidylinositol mannoside acyltransferase [Georgenia sp. Z1491]|uniref:LpxL/LpxP family acyltransferase n=1 Tax=Georgenia sp. Z1491 TaxID=3416707 RepID=UPI003CEDCC90